MEFSPSPATDPNIFHPRLDLETSPEGWRAELLTVPESWRCTCGIFTKTRRLSKHFPPRLELQSFPDGWRPELLIFPGCRLRIRARFSPPAPVQTFPTAPGVVEFPRRLAARPREISTKPRHQSGHFLPTARVVGFSLRKMATVWVFHQARRQAGHFLHIALDSGLFRGPPRVVFSQTACGILAPLRNWHSRPVGETTP